MAGQLKRFDHNDWSLLIDLASEGQVRFDTYAPVHVGSETRQANIINIPAETAHALADWIIANVPKPAPKTAWDHWLDFEVGQVFTIGRSGNNYRKISATEAVYLGDKETYKIDPDMKTNWSPQKYDFLSEVVLPLPTKRAAVVKSGVAVFTLADSEEPRWLELDSNGDLWLPSDALAERGFEVIFEGVDE